MLNIIKSPFNIQIILNNLNEAKKLKIIKYNKKIQNKISINLANFIVLSKRYIIYDNHLKNKGKEYNYNDKLIYEGEYLNFEKNGKGREYYDNGKLKFEGEYLNGKRNGKIKEFNEDGKFIFVYILLKLISIIFN